MSDDGTCNSGPKACQADCGMIVNFSSSTYHHRLSMKSSDIPFLPYLSVVQAVP